MSRTSRTRGKLSLAMLSYIIIKVHLSPDDQVPHEPCVSWLLLVVKKTFSLFSFTSLHLHSISRPEVWSWTFEHRGPWSFGVWTTHNISIQRSVLLFRKKTTLTPPRITRLVEQHQITSLESSHCGRIVTQKHFRAWIFEYWAVQRHTQHLFRFPLPTYGMATLTRPQSISRPATNILLNSQIPTPFPIDQLYQESCQDQQPTCSDSNVITPPENAQVASSIDSAIEAPSTAVLVSSSSTFHSALSFTTLFSRRMYCHLLPMFRGLV